MLFIPAGTRCSAASILENKFERRRFSLPMDWIDTPLRNIAQFIDLDADQVEGFVKTYFGHVNISEQRHPDGTWLPHDIVLQNYGGNYAAMMAAVIEKYTKRMHRLHEHMRTDEDKTFLSVLAHGGMGGYDDFLNMKRAAERRCGGKLSFVTVNVLDYELVDGGHFNFVVKLDRSKPETGWDEWEQQIVSAIDSNEVLHNMFRQ